MAAKKKTAATNTRKTRSRTERDTSAENLISLDRKKRAKAVMDLVNKRAGAGVVQMAEDANCSYLLRRPTGIIGIDIGLAGGFPAAATSIITGPDGIGKDYLLGKTCATVQQIYQEDFCMVAYFTEFMIDKMFMRNICGLQIALSNEELAEQEESRAKYGLPPLTEERRAELQTQIGDIHLIQGVSAEEGFDALIDYVRANVAQIAVVNSIGFMQTEAKEDVESFKGFAQQRNEAMLMSKFMPKLSMILNRQEYGKNETSLVLINQVRSKDNSRTMPGRIPQEKDKYKSAVGAWALKHGKAIELMLHRGSRFYDKELKLYLGREVSWELVKGKLGTHDGVKGSYSYFYDIGADVIQDLVNTAILYNVIEKNGAHYTYDGEAGDFKAHGAPAVLEILKESDEEALNAIRQECLIAADVICRYI